MNIFKINLQRAEKKRDKKREIYDILNVIHTTITDILYRYIDKIKIESSIEYAKLSNSDRTEAQNILDEIPEIIKYANECFINVSRVYNSRYKVIDCNTLIFR